MIAGACRPRATVARGLPDRDRRAVGEAGAEGDYSSRLCYGARVTFRERPTYRCRVSTIGGPGIVTVFGYAPVLPTDLCRACLGYSHLPVRKGCGLARRTECGS